jgi:hypothetical protein
VVALMSANIDYESGRVTRLDRLPEARTPLTEGDVKEPATLVRILDGLLRDLAKVLGLWRPRRLDWVDVTLDATGTTLFRFEHRFDGVVRFWVVDWDGAAAHNVRKDTTTDDNTLVLTSTSAGAATIRVEEAG